MIAKKGVILVSLAWVGLLHSGALAFSNQMPMMMQHKSLNTNDNHNDSKSTTVAFLANALNFRDNASVMEEQSKDLTERRIRPKSFVSRLAWVLTTQLIYSLKKEERLWKRKDNSISSKIEPMTRFLNTRMLFGSTALEFVRASVQMIALGDSETTTTEEAFTGGRFGALEALSSTARKVEAENILEIVDGGQTRLSPLPPLGDKDIVAFDSDYTDNKDFFFKDPQADFSTTAVKLEDPDRCIFSKPAMGSSSKSGRDKDVFSGVARPLQIIDNESERVENSNVDKLRQEATEMFQSFEKKVDKEMKELNVEDLRREASEVSHSFKTQEFKPAWFARNNHLQTIAGVFSRDDSAYFPSTTNSETHLLKSFQWDERQRVETSDGDFFDVDWKFSDSHDRVGRPSTHVPVVLICHGLQSNSDSPLAREMAMSFNHIGMDAACINFRGCSGELNRLPMGYHLSFTDDLAYMVELVAAKRPGAPIYLSGFSLGANVVTKYLADMGTDALKYNICGAAVNAIPFNLTATRPNFNDPGISKSLYGDRLLESLTNRVVESMEVQNYTFSKEQLLQCKTVLEFDDLVVCSVYDFDDADDYHRKSSTSDILHKVMVPVFVVQALDDPFMVGQENPPNDSEMPLRIQYTEEGGHCGYVFHSEQNGDCKTSWMPTQLARFLKHVEENKVKKDEASKPDQIIRSSEEEKRKRHAARVSHAFETREFSPEWYATNPHFQTIMGTLYREETMYSNPMDGILTLPWEDKKAGPITRFQWDERQRMETIDGDFFDVDWKFSNLGERVDKSSVDVPLVLICHGLQSNSESPLVKDMTIAFKKIGLDVACINFRGCSGEINLTPTGYHLGFTADLKQMIEHVNNKFPHKRIYLSGFSLGANVVTKCLAEMGDTAHKYNICGAAVNAIPFDMTKSNLNLNEDGITKSIYGDRLLKSMIQRVEESYDTIGFSFPREKARECKTIMDMENLVIAPVFGFEDAWDYYKKCSTKNILDEVSVPQFVIQCLDDPFFEGQENPTNDAERPLRISYTKHGGHCGYVFHTKKEDEKHETSWMPTELARFLSHVEENLQSRSDNAQTNSDSGRPKYQEMEIPIGATALE